MVEQDRERGDVAAIVIDDRLEVAGLAALDEVEVSLGNFAPRDVIRRAADAEDLSLERRKAKIGETPAPHAAGEDEEVDVAAFARPGDAVITRSCPEPGHIETPPVERHPIRARSEPRGDAAQESSLEARIGRQDLDDLESPAPDAESAEEGDRGVPESTGLDVEESEFVDPSARVRQRTDQRPRTDLCTEEFLDERGGSGIGMRRQMRSRIRRRIRRRRRAGSVRSRNAVAEALVPDEEAILEYRPTTESAEDRFARNRRRAAHASGAERHCPVPRSWQRDGAPKSSIRSAIR
jgi:hypothetical protein